MVATRRESRPAPAGTLLAEEWEGWSTTVRDVRIENVPDPRIESPTDALVEVVATNIYGEGAAPRGVTAR